MKRIALLTLLLTVSLANAEEKTFTGPAAQIKTYIEELFEASKKVNTPGQMDAARAKIENALDWDRISADALGKASKKAGGKLGEFKKLLKEVIVRTAYTRLDKFWEGGTTYKFDKIDVKGNTAEVAAKFTVKNEAFGLDYFLHQKGGKWFVNDIAFEGLRYSTNINEQIEAFLSEKSFNDLLGKLRKRRDDLVADAAKAGKK